jgi:hypothetical protein
LTANWHHYPQTQYFQLAETLAEAAADKRITYKDVMDLERELLDAP